MEEVNDEPYKMTVEDIKKLIEEIPTKNIGNDNYLKGWNDCLDFVKRITGIIPLRFPEGASELL